MPGLKVYRPDGLQVVDVGSGVALPLNSVLIGGDNQSQSGTVYDSRLTSGNPYYLVTTLEVNGFIGYRPNITFSGGTLYWSWPPNTGNGAGGTLPYPRCRFIYGLR